MTDTITSWPEMTFRIDMSTVRAKSRVLTAEYTIELEPEGRCPKLLDALTPLFLA